MSGVGFLRIKKLKGSGIITVAARHNRRVIQAELGASGAIDPARSCLNEILRGPPTAGEVGQLAKDLMLAAGVTRLRKDAVMALEIVFSLPPGHEFDDRAFFVDCTGWAEAYFGGNVLSADIHRDEAAGHCHVLLLPLVGSRMDGGRMVGGKQKLMAMQKEFHDTVAERHGLSKAPARLSGEKKRAAAQSVIQRMQATADPALKSAAWGTIRDKIENDPLPFLVALNLAPKAIPKKLKTVVEIFTSKGKGKVNDPISIDFARTKKRQSLCSVDFPARTSSTDPAAVVELSTAKAGACDEPDGAAGHSGRNAPVVPETIRVRDCDLDPEMYDPTTGEYFSPPLPTPRSQARAAQNWVANALAKRSVQIAQAGTRTTRRGSG